jgi:hypothetical protein|tara:strand:+ start:553 stop:864 length:312 start_codon:yes stop_codon:yes gene_type:complete
MANRKKLFFGWTKIKWVISEISKLYSGEKSYFSKKRVESGIGFIIAQWGMIYFLTKKIDVLSMSDLAVWAGIEFLVAGYTVTQIQSEKKLKKISEPTDTMIKS